MHVLVSVRSTENCPPYLTTAMLLPNASRSGKAIKVLLTGSTNGFYVSSHTALLKETE